MTQIKRTFLNYTLLSIIIFVSISVSQRVSGLRNILFTGPLLGKNYNFLCWAVLDEIFRFFHSHHEIRRTSLHNSSIHLISFFDIDFDQKIHGIVPNYTLKFLMPQMIAMTRAYAFYGHK